jgi:hypothetical protein
VATFYGLTDDTNIKTRLEELLDADGKRLEALENLELYRSRMQRTFDRRVRPRTFKKGDLVWVMSRSYMAQGKGSKFEPKWEGPYVVECVYDGGSYLLTESEGLRPLPPINGKFLKPYYM